MKDKTAYNALSSESRLKILKLLHKKALSVEEIAELMNLQPITVRHHLQSLQDAGFIESYEERSGTVGRPRVYYQIAKEPTTVGYPKRRYLNLSNFLIKTLLSLIGTDRAGSILQRVGENMGINVVREIESKNDVKNWSSDTFLTYFINEYLEKAGSEPEIMVNDGNQIIYRVHNCLFLELAVKMPETMCDILHEAFHDGVTKAMGGNAKISKITCMGRGDTYCEHKCEWQS